MSSSDPSNLLNSNPNQQPTIVKIQGTSREELNGKLGIVLQYSADRGRYTIHMTSSQTCCALKPDNIVKASMMETYQAQFQQLRNDPRVRQQISMYYNRVQSMLPPPLKPEYILGGVLALLAVCIYFIGFSKTLMFLSILMLLGVLVAPDIMSGSRISLQSVAANFPRRCRESIEQTAPFLKGKITNRIAAGLVMFMLIMSGKALFTPTTSPTKSKAAPMSVNNRATITIEEAYKLGYDDAQNGYEYRKSLNDQKSKVIDDDDEIQYDYKPTSPPPPPGGGSFLSKFGIGQMMSVFYLYRMATQLGNNGAGTFDPQVLIANAKNLPPWQLGMFGFSMYNLLRPFFGF